MEENASLEGLTPSQIAEILYGPRPVYVDEDGDPARDNLILERMRQLRVPTYIATGSPDGNFREYYLRFAVDGSVVDAVTGEIVGHLDPVTQNGRWMLCAGKVHIHCLEFESSGVSQVGTPAWRLVGRYLDGKPLPLEP